MLDNDDTLPTEPVSENIDSAPVIDDSQEENSVDESSSNVESVPQAEGNTEPAGFTKRIHQKHHELMEERRAREAVEAELEQLRNQQPTAQRPEVPPLPDPYDDDFDIRMKERDAAVLEVATYDFRQQQTQAEQQRQEQQRALEQQNKIIDTVKTYANRATALNISAKELEVAGQTVAAYGIDDQLTQYILNDEQGPLITRYLARNPAELEAIQAMSPMQAAVHVAVNVKTKAGANQNANRAPAPADTLGGGGTAPKGRGPKGARFE